VAPAPPPAPCAAAAGCGGTAGPPFMTAASALAVGVWTRDTVADGLPAALVRPDINTDREEVDAEEVDEPEEEEEPAAREADVTPALRRCNIYSAA